MHTHLCDYHTLGTVYTYIIPMYIHVWNSHMGNNGAYKQWLTHCPLVHKVISENSGGSFLSFCIEVLIRSTHFQECMLYE